MQPASAPHQVPEPWGRTAIWCRAALIFGWLAILVLAVGYGERHSSYAALEGAIRDGKVDRVEVAGDFATSSNRFSGPVVLSWRRGLIRDTTTVLETGPRGGFGHRDDVTAVIHGSVSRRLRAEGIDVQSRPTPTSSAGPILGWSLPGWTFLPLIAVFFGTLISIGASPEPWRATRWAWFWLVFVASPIGMIAYVALAGPTPFIRAPGTTRRLTGGWALLLAMVISAATATGAAVS